MTAKEGRPHTGGCQCGAVRYAIAGDPLEIYVCHCRECQKQSASAFGITVLVRRSDVQITRGELSWWSRKTDTGRTLKCGFCPTCGSRVLHERPAMPDTISIKGGSFDDPVDLGPAIHIWTSRKLPGVVIPDGARQYPKEPD